MSDINILDAKQFLPDNLKNTELYGKIIDLLNVLMSDKENTFKQIRMAYLDTLYKMKDYNIISFGAKLTTLQDNGFGYLVDVLALDDQQLVRLMVFLDLIYVLKGTIPGLRLVLDTLNLIATYELWDEPGIDQLTGNVIGETDTRGQPFTSKLTITGATFEQYQVFTKVRDFIRSYMLPYVTIDIVMEITAPTVYVSASSWAGTRIIWDKIFSYQTSVKDIAVYDLGNGYDLGLYGVRASGSMQITTLTIRPVPEDAIVTINGAVAQNGVQIVPQNSIASWKVERDGYITRTGQQEIKQSPVSLPIYLEEKGTGVLFTIIPYPDNAIVTINGIEVNGSLEVPFNSQVEWNVSAEGYESKKGSTQVQESNVVLEVTLIPKVITLSIEPTPSNATVLINNIRTNTFRGDYGTQVEWNVSAEGYESKKSQLRLERDTYLNVVLDPVRVSFTLLIETNDGTAEEGSPEDYVVPYQVLIFGVEQNYVQVLPGQQIAWEVKALNGYTPKVQTGVEVIYEDTILTKNVWPPDP